MTQLEAFFFLNANDDNARKYLYDEIPQYYVWNESDRVWNLRKRGKQIGRISYTHHSSGELWYLRLLLTKVRGPTSYESLRTVDRHLFSTFQEACKEYGLLDDDREWHEVLEQCATCGFPPQIRQLFVHIMVNCKVSDLKLLWNSHWNKMNDDILLTQRKLTNNPLFLLNDKQLEYYALAGNIFYSYTTNFKFNNLSFQRITFVHSTVFSNIMHFARNSQIVKIDW